jgi:hypothetical protein
MISWMDRLVEENLIFQMILERVCVCAVSDLWWVVQLFNLLSLQIIRISASPSTVGRAKAVRKPTSRVS